VEVLASNGKYAGATSFYSEADGSKLIELGNKLSGFPKVFGQVEEQEFGLTKKENIYLKESHLWDKTYKAYVGLQFFCLDRHGHTAVSIILFADDISIERHEAKKKVSFELQFDPAQLDVFVQELIVLGERREGKATLIGRTDDSRKM
jgi:hypothetical protein